MGGGGGPAAGGTAGMSFIEELTTHCEHPPEKLWLTRQMVKCGGCHSGFNRKVYPALADDGS